MTKKKTAKPQSNEKELLLVALLLGFVLLLISQKKTLQAKAYELFGGTDTPPVVVKTTLPKTALPKTTVRK